MSCGVGRRRGSDLVLLWLWRRLAAVAANRSLAWELLYAAPAALKSKIKKAEGVPVVVQWRQIRLRTMRLRVRSLASLSGLRIQRCHELWCWWQTWLGSGLAVALM